MLRFGCEKWALRKLDEKRITTAEMRFLRKTVIYTLLDRKRNVDIHKELRITPILSKFKVYWRKWRELIEWMDMERSPKQMLE